MVARLIGLFLLVASSALAQTSYVMEFNPITEAQTKSVVSFIDNNIENFQMFHYEYTPVSGTKDLDKDTLRVFFIGSDDDVKALGRKLVRRANNRNIVVTLDKVSKGLRQGLLACVQTHGKKLKDRPALKVCCNAEFRENRAIGKDSRAALKRWLNRRGFASIKEFRQWLNLKP